MIHAAEQDRPDVAQARAHWRIEQLGLDPSKLVFIDETWAKTNMTRIRGRALQGQRLVAKVPHGHWKTTTLIAALGHVGMRCSATIDGAVNQQVFEAFVEQVLIKSLKPGDLVIMDNLSSHKGVKVRELMASAGARVLYLPPYSPDLNPIELAFSKLKQLLRSAAHRSVDALWRDVQRMLDEITASDAMGFYRHCGYTLQEK
jgi:transposase